MQDSSDSAINARLDRLTAMLERRLDRIEERLLLLESDATDMVALLIAIRACLDQTLADGVEGRPAIPTREPFLN